MACRRLSWLVITALLLAACADHAGPSTQTATADRCLTLRPAPPFTGYRGALPTTRPDALTRC